MRNSGLKETADLSFILSPLLSMMLRIASKHRRVALFVVRPPLYLASSSSFLVIMMAMDLVSTARIRRREFQAMGLMTLLPSGPSYSRCLMGVHTNEVVGLGWISNAHNNVLSYFRALSLDFIGSEPDLEQFFHLRLAESICQNYHFILRDR